MLSSFKVHRLTSIALSILLLLECSFLFPRSSDAAESGEALFNRFKDAVVKVEIGAGDRRSSHGTGFFISGTGLILTNAHVVQTSKSRFYYSTPSTLRELSIRTFDGRQTREVEILACGDPRGVDLCLLQTTLRSSVWFGVEAEPAPQGEHVFIIGHPLGLDFSISDGMISGTRRSSIGTGEVIQVSAPISAGNSGGPIFNSGGKLRGVATYFNARGQNLNFGVSSAEVERFLSGVKKGTLPKFSGSQGAPPTSTSAITFPSVSRSSLPPSTSPPYKSELAQQGVQFMQALRLGGDLDAVPGFKKVKVRLGGTPYFLWVPTPFSDCQSFNWMESTVCTNSEKSARLEITRLSIRAGFLNELCLSAPTAQTKLMEEFNRSKNSESRWKLEATYPTLAIGGNIGATKNVRCAEGFAGGFRGEYGKGAKTAQFFQSRDRQARGFSEHTLVQEFGSPFVTEVSAWTNDTKDLGFYFKAPTLTLFSVRKAE